MMTTNMNERQAEMVWKFTSNGFKVHKQKETGDNCIKVYAEKDGKTAVLLFCCEEVRRGDQDA